MTVNERSFPMVRIAWIDSMRSEGWRSVNSAEDELRETTNYGQTEMDCETVGFMIGENATGVMIARDIGIHGRSVCDTIIIPKSAITERWVLTIGPMK